MLLIVANAGAPAAANASAAMIVGPGTLSCGQWLTDRQGLYSANNMEAWIAGYLSAFNTHVAQGNIMKNMDSAELFLWLDNYCHAHPLDDVAVATDRLIDALKER